MARRTGLDARPRSSCPTMSARTAPGGPVGAGVREVRLPIWEELTSAEVDALVREDPVAVLPLAAVEQHGPHLPLSTDIEIGRGILEAAFTRLPDGFPARVLPTQSIGASAEHMSYPGTLSLGPEHLIRTICRIGGAVRCAGVRRLVIFNSHGGNRAAMDIAGLRLRRQCGLLVVRTSYSDVAPPDAAGIDPDELRHGLHGGMLETSMMIHLRPELVRTPPSGRRPSLGEDLERAGSPIAPTGPAAFSWLAEDLDPSGVTGEAECALAETGRVLVDHYGAALARVIEAARAFPLERLGEG